MSRARALVVQHFEVEGPGLLGDSLERAGCEVEVVRVDLGGALPAGLGGHDALVVMGGPMSATSDEGFPTRSQEIGLLREALAGEVPVLGVCLGAQLLALAAGGSVHPGSTPEIGWAPVRVEPGAAGDPLLDGAGDELTVLHWHGETFDLPEGAVHLASTAAYANQAFRIGPCAWGFQFHMEVDGAAVARFLAAFPEEASLAPGGAEAIAVATADSLVAWEPMRSTVLDRFASLATSRGSRESP